MRSERDRREFRLNAGGKGIGQTLRAVQGRALLTRRGRNWRTLPSGMMRAMSDSMNGLRPGLTHTFDSGNADANIDEVSREYDGL